MDDEGGEAGGVPALNRCYPWKPAECSPQLVLSRVGYSNDTHLDLCCAYLLCVI